MLAAGLLAFVSLHGLRVLAAPGKLSCYTDLPLKDWSLEQNSQLRAALENPSTNVCYTAPKKIDKGETVVVTAGGAVFDIWSENDGQDVKGCSSAFANTISEYLQTQNLTGGEYESEDGLLYGVTHASVDVSTIANEGTSRSIVARAPQGNARGGRSRSRPRPKTKPKTKPKKNSKTKSKTKPKIHLKKTA
ncbi:hypothetical protein P171DRAFT_195796 [Karstenula rhodostoma CBS 690.94]|uniref:Uncharacterized protein n=1 Tax=Karstenula rhodostoma CBS 690.94 TaxID=1392251 RepID=A0A9P4PUP0_9PLEO|nr:hypothetical protein P171DRAFT_195796 [Karstenula rhodostoma CBS 690.94]